MHRLVAGLLGVSVITTLSACSSSSPGSIDDLRKVIEASGYECDDATTENDGDKSVDCGDEIYASWYDSAAGEVAAFDAITSLYEGIPGSYAVELYVIRGDRWRISGDKGAVMKVADSLDMDMDSVSN